MTCPMPQLSGRLECAEGPFFGATCALLCDPGYVPSDLQASCITQSMAPEAEPSFMPPAACTPGLCGDYQWLEGASVAYPNERRDVTSRAFLTCSSGYKPAGAALSLEGTVELRCGPVIDRENEPEVEWKVAFTGARAGLICAPEGMAVYDTVVLLGSITLTMALPDALNKDSLCTQYKDRFVGDVGLALVMALSSAGQVPLTASSVLNVEVSVCSGLGVRLRRLSSLNTTVSFAVKVENDLQALMLQAAVTEAAASAIFVRVFTVSLASSTGIQTSDIETSRMTRDILYLIDKPDGTQVPVAGASARTTRTIAPTTPQARMMRRASLALPPSLPSWQVAAAAAAVVRAIAIYGGAMSMMSTRISRKARKKASMMTKSLMWSHISRGHRMRQK
ncbi:unnamed protein product [Effrenium voratum]|nr:unnamed protein product [Effrenium voratum]